MRVDHGGENLAKKSNDFWQKNNCGEKKLVQCEVEIFILYG